MPGHTRDVLQAQDLAGLLLGREDCHLVTKLKQNEFIKDVSMIDPTVNCRHDIANCLRLRTLARHDNERIDINRRFVAGPNP